MTWLRIAGWGVFAAGCLLALAGNLTGRTSLLKWGLIVGGAGMIGTYAVNLVRIYRSSRVLPPGMKRSKTGAQNRDGDKPAL
jgi:NADPH:quinone reductase-like Zn-dependent oxidoreductase